MHCVSGVYIGSCAVNLFTGIAKLMKNSYHKANEDLVLKVFSHFDMQSSYSSDKLYVHYFQERNVLMVNIWKHYSE